MSSNYDNDWLGERRFSIVDVSDAFYESGFNVDDVLKDLGIKNGFCCEQFKLDYENSNGTIENITQIPILGEPNKLRSCCIYCGKNPDKYTKVDS